MFIRPCVQHSLLYIYTFIYTIAMASKYLNVILLLCSLMIFCQGTPIISPRRLFCCVEYQIQPIPIKSIKGYRMQSSREMCHIDAVIFTTMNNREVCGNKNDEWVRKALDQSSKKNKKMSGSN
ncbi:hypothetical protein DPEC_G00061140 [Dallia pectoralis]|uniref:Uncharacterized protein n=1 Tax=Dallia pectoralis TaxID=75939 RepID=A0ACC2H707_DALPE|nr:hypothetical protein DPEC_G00061140 [Dallia pectoralis]